MPDVPDLVKGTVWLHTRQAGSAADLTDHPAELSGEGSFFTREPLSPEHLFALNNLPSLSLI